MVVVVAEVHVPVQEEEEVVNPVEVRWVHEGVVVVEEGSEIPSVVKRVVVVETTTMTHEEEALPYHPWVRTLVPDVFPVS